MYFIFKVTLNSFVTVRCTEAGYIQELRIRTGHRGRCERSNLLLDRLKIPETNDPVYLEEKRIVFLTWKQTFVAKKIKSYGYLMMNHDSINSDRHQYARAAAAPFQVSSRFSYLQCFFVVYLLKLSVDRQQKK